ncbi:MAG: SH3 domain-containing protein [Eubacterium sp.]|nr:SH3 domain-containing protein [Eubacterium sp.]
MNYKSLRKATCCFASALTLAVSPMIASASPIAGASDLTSVNVTSELTASSPTSGISLLLSQYLAENTISVNNVAKQSTAATTVTAVESRALVQQEEATDTKEIKEKKEKVMIVAQVEGYVNVRAKANEDSEVLGKLYDDSVGTVIKEKDGWYKIKSGSVTGYVKADYVTVASKKLLRKVGTRIATVDTTSLRVRAKASEDAKVLDLVAEGKKLTVLSEDKKDEGWVKVSIGDAKGYVSVDYVTLSTQYTYAESKEEEAARLAEEEADRQAEEAARAAEEAVANNASNNSSNNSSNASKPSKSNNSSSSSSSSSNNDRQYSAPSGANGQAVANYACQFVGNPYVYGGSSLTNGADCSGFVMAVYAAFGVSLPHSSSAQRSVGYGVSIDEIQPGDIVCYSGHVGIYVGNNTIVHASSPSTGIKYTSPITYRTVLAVRRIF